MELITELKDKIRVLEFENSCDYRKRYLAVEEAKNVIRKEMEKSLIESDLLRVEAVAKLEAYEKINTKEDHNHLMKMLEKSIEALGKQKQEVKVIK